MYNVGPDFKRNSSGAMVICGDCHEEVTPEFDGCEGEFRCPNCYNPLPDYIEEE